MTLQDILLKSKKEVVYDFYLRLDPNAKDYDKVSRSDIYKSVISLYQDDPEIILRMCNIEEIELLKKLLKEQEPISSNTYVGYVSYVALKNLIDNFLITKEDNYHIPDDLKNIIKMAINLFDYQTIAQKSMKDNIYLGIIRTWNVIEINDFISLMSRYNIEETNKTIYDFISYNTKLNDKIGIIKYNKKTYLYSLEFPYWKDVLPLRENTIIPYEFTLEEIISIGKYKINLFHEEIFKYLNFLELHLNPSVIENLIDKLIIYAGLDLNNDEALRILCDNVEELYKKTVAIIDAFPSWLYFGNSVNTLKEHVILPNKNDLCPCGSGKKYKHCCMKKAHQ